MLQTCARRHRAIGYPASHRMHHVTCGEVPEPLQTGQNVLVMFVACALITRREESSTWIGLASFQPSFPPSVPPPALCYRMSPCWYFSRKRKVRPADRGPWVIEVEFKESRNGGSMEALARHMPNAATITRMQQQGNRVLPRLSCSRSPAHGIANSWIDHSLSYVSG